MRRTKELMELDCELSDQQKLATAKELGQIFNRMTGLQRQKAALDKEMKEKINDLEGQVAGMCETLHNGTERRKVNCKIKYDFKRKKKTWFRDDTKKIVKTLPLSDDDIQEDLKLKGGKDKKAEKTKTGKPKK